MWTLAINSKVRTRRESAPVAPARAQLKRPRCPRTHRIPCPRPGRNVPRAAAALQHSIDAAQVPARSMFPLHLMLTVGEQAALASLHPKPLRGEQATLRCPWSSINSQACPLWAGRGGQAWRAPSSPSWPTDSCQQAGARHSCRHASRARPPAPPGRGRSRRDRDGCVARRGQTQRLARR